MCEQCLANPVSFGQPLRGFWLMRARRDGDNWKKGEWGLVECNDPTFYWVSTPRVLSDTEWEPEDFHDAFMADPSTGYRLVAAAVEKGYDPTEGGFESWFFNYLVEYLKTAEAVDEGDLYAIDDLEKFSPSDFSIGKDPKPELEAELLKLYK